MAKAAKKPEAPQAPEAEKAKPGRPSKYSAALVESICARLAQGEPMAVICRDGDPAISAAIARAREEGYDAIAAYTLEIADDSRNDWTDAKAEEGDERAINSRENGEVIQRSKLRIDTRLKLLAKWDPKRYGDKVQHANDPDNPMPGGVTFVVMPTAPAGKPE
jgi:hypothetical protein